MIKLPTIKKLSRRDKQFTLLLIGVFAFAILWRFLWLGSIPHGLSSHEIFFLDKAFDLTKSWRIPGSDMTSALYLYMLALVGKLSGFNILTLRIVQSILSLATILLFYFFTKEWFSRRVAIIATLFLTINAFYLTLSRVIDPVILIPLFLILVTYLYTLAFERDKYYLFALAGFASGLSLYVDKLFFVLPIFFIMTYYYFRKKNPDFLKKYWRKSLLSLGIFLVVAIPYFLALPQTIPVLLSSYNPGSIGRFFIGMGTLISALIYSTPVNRLYYIGSLSLLSPFIAVTFLCGLVYAFFHIERRIYYFLIVVFVVLSIILSLGLKDAPGNYLAIFPIVFILAATIFEYLLNVWFKTFPYNKTARLTFTLVLSFFVFLSVYYNYQKFFEAWGHNPEVKDIYSHSFDISDK